MTACRYASRPEASAAPSHVDDLYRGIPDSIRPAAATYLTLPEWFIVYSTEEYAASLHDRGASAFPYFRAIADYWSYYRAVCQASCGKLPFDPGDHVMLVVIGGSFTIENAVKGIYENSIGRVSDALGGHDTEEDQFAAQVADDYARFMHTVPWYEFPFGARLAALWANVPLRGHGNVRKWERRVALTAEYSAKALYGKAIQVLTKSTYGEEGNVTYVHVDRLPARTTATLAKRLDDGTAIVAVGRYEAFAAAAADLSTGGAHLIDVAGNEKILISAIAPFGNQWAHDLPVVYSRPVGTDLPRVRALLAVDVRRLGTTLATLRSRGVTLEHIYDY